MVIRVHWFGEKAISQDENNGDAYSLKWTIFVSFYFFSIFSDWMRQFALRKFLRLSQFKIIVTPLNSAARVGSNFRRINLMPGSLTDHDLNFCFQNWVVTNWDSFPFDCIFCSPDQNLFQLKGIKLNFRNRQQWNIPAMYLIRSEYA